MLTIEEIHTREEMERLSAAWMNLQAATSAESIFLSPDWFCTCARHLGPGQQLLVLAVRENKNLVGVVPLLWERTHKHSLPVNRIGFLVNPLTPFVDAILLDPLPAWEAVLQHLAAFSVPWHVLFLDGLREDSRSLGALPIILARRGWMFGRHETGRAPVLRMDSTWKDFFGSKSVKFRKTRRSVTNKVERLGTVQVEHISSADGAAVALEELLEVSSRSWKRRQSADHIAPEFERAFFTDLTETAVRTGRLSIWLLRVNGRVIAGEYHLQDKGTVYGLRAHYDEEYANSSPGSYLDVQIIRHMFETGCVAYDMGPGAAQYKLAWTEDHYRCYGIELFNRGFYAQALGRVSNKWLPALKSSRLGQWAKRRLLRDSDQKKQEAASHDD